MRHDVDIVRLAPTGYLFCLGQPTDVRDVEPRVIQQPLLDEGSECPLARKLFADCEWHARHAPELAIRLRALGTDRLFHEMEVQRLDALAEQGRLRYR